MLARLLIQVGSKPLEVWLEIVLLCDGMFVYWCYFLDAHPSIARGLGVDSRPLDFWLVIALISCFSVLIFSTQGLAVNRAPWYWQARLLVLVIG